MNSFLEFSNNVDFFCIPGFVRKSRKFELLFTNEKGNGVIQVI